MILSYCNYSLKFEAIALTWNQRQLYRQKYPQYNPYPMEFLYH